MRVDGGINMETLEETGIARAVAKIASMEGHSAVIARETVDAARGILKEWRKRGGTRGDAGEFLGIRGGSRARGFRIAMKDEEGARHGTTMRRERASEREYGAIKNRY